MDEKPAQVEELLKQGADLLANIFVEQIIRKHSQSKIIKQTLVHEDNLND